MRRALPFLAVSFFAALAAADQPFDIRPGLWKFTTTLNAGNGAETFSRSNCITAEDVRAVRLLQMTAAPGRSCASEVTRQSATALEGVVECVTGAGKSRTRVRFAASSPTKLTGTMQAVGGGMPQGVALTIAAEWSAAQCPADS